VSRQGLRGNRTAMWRFQQVQMLCRAAGQLGGLLREPGDGRQANPRRLRRRRGCRWMALTLRVIGLAMNHRYRAKLPPISKTRPAASATAFPIGFRQKLRPQVALVRELPVGGRQRQRDK
jgi:hypothetical protein